MHSTMEVSEEDEDGVFAAKSAGLDQNDSEMTANNHVTERSDSPVPSVVSMRSDWSKSQLIEFKDGHQSDQQIQKKDRSDSALTSLFSMKSDSSKSQPIEFKDGLQSDQQIQVIPKSPDPPAPNCVSMKSDCCSVKPTEFKAGQQRFEESHMTSYTDQESLEFVSDHQTHLDSVFMMLQEDIFTFVKKELKTFKKFLSQQSPEGSESLREDDELLADKEEEISDSDRETFLSLTLNFLRRKKHDQLADSLQRKTSAAICQCKLKSNLRRKFQFVSEGTGHEGKPTLLNQVYTELHITEGERTDRDQHEVLQIEATSTEAARTNNIIRSENIFKPLPGRDEAVRTVVTKGVAGIGKTVLTQKYTLDWAENKANHNKHFIFPLTFRELNLLNSKQYSLVELLHYIFTDTKEAGICSFEEFQVVFILDGLDECRLPLDFHSNKILTDVTESTSLDVLLTNLIRGNLLPSAHLWITTRPAAANQIPPQYVDMVTEVRGFPDSQKEEYFRRRFRDEEEENRIISHIGTSRSLHIMCHIPVFCWITSTVLDHVLKTKEKAALPKTLTEMYIHFLLVQTKQDNVKYLGKPETVWNKEAKEMFLALGKLAFEQLQKRNFIFYEAELKDYGIDIKTASVYSGLFTEVFSTQHGLNHERVFCFIHLSVQEFLAALYVLRTFVNTGVNLLRRWRLSVKYETAYKHLYQDAVDKALQSPNGHLDLFVRFLLGLSLDANQTLLQGLLKKTESKPKVRKKLVQYIKKKIKDSPSPERSINLFHCLNELNDNSLVEEIQQHLRSGSFSKSKLTSSQWSALIFILLSSQKDLDMFDLKKFSASDEGLLQLLPVVKASQKSLLSSCNLSWRSCFVVATILSSVDSNLRELDLSNNDLRDEGVNLLSAGLKSPQCRLEILRLSGCLITESSCHTLASALNSNPSHLRELDLSFNHPGDSGVELLSALQQDPKCKLETLKTDHCGKCRMNPSPLRFFCELTLDPNTAERNLDLTSDNKAVVLVKEKQPYPDHTERFDGWKQLLSSDGLTGRCYWEVKWKGRVRIGVTYRGIRRKGDTDDCCIGWNDQSWSLFCSAQGFTAWHNNTPTDIETPTDSNRVAVYLDWAAGTVSFYCLPSIVSSIKQTHLHTFHTTFTEPLYAAFGFGREREFEPDFTSSWIILANIIE
ncbi:NACHT, LRR and PYD domains-containing protein 9-like [Archocentrus centrarchus]|uniref:NACHT, LRR and PYD domains-containing protein 9-like n=1 Tax=Archocentrus centrarchus TaxID=63155 RepID=UPI0011EA20A2|nr:NACHT, LRR and PYD domains-containing protein 9-like [Archocentrus centrarchus]